MSSSAENRSEFQPLVQEFRDVISNYEYKTPVATQAMVVLSGPPDIKRDGTYKEFSRENIARIWFAIQLCKSVAAEREGVDLEDANLHKGPRLILNGETEQLPYMERIALRRLSYPIEMIDEINCGDRGIGNTKTQIEAIANNEKFSDYQDVTFVTSGYHKPRVDRTINKVIDNEVNSDTIPVPYGAFRYNVFRKARGEIKRIAAYSEKGDISK